MPYIRNTNDNQSKRIPCGSDFSRGASILRDKLYIVSAPQELSRIMACGFRYNIGIFELEVYLNGTLLRSNETIKGSSYGDYEENSSYSVLFNFGIINIGDRVRFRITSNSYDYSSVNQNNITQLLEDNSSKNIEIERLETEVFISSWLTTSSLTEAKDYLAGCGTNSNALCFGGYDIKGDRLDSTEIWNDSIWATTSSLSESKRLLAGCGTISNAICFGGETGSGAAKLDTTEIWNGSIWATTNPLTQKKMSLAGCGTISAALCFGGIDNSAININETEIWSGSSWATTNPLNEINEALAGCGTISAALCFGGYTGGAPIDTTEIWNGSSWVTTSSLNEVKAFLAGCGITSNALCFGGDTGAKVDTTEIWNGSVWVTTSSLNKATQELSGCGTNSKALAFGGETGSSVKTSITEKWNNSCCNNTFELSDEDEIHNNQIERLESRLFVNSWTTTNSLNEAKVNAAGCGTVTAALCFGGEKTGGKTDITEIWNSNSWATTNPLNEAKSSLAGCGTTTNALCFGGNTTGAVDTTEIWTGVWRTGGSLNKIKYLLAGCGTSSNALCFGGNTGANTNETEIWNGSAWATTNPLNEAKSSLAGCGTSSAALCFGGNSGGGLDTTEIWNGSSWATTSPLNEAKSSLAGCGTSSAALCFGGHTGNIVNTTEVWNGSAWVTTSSLNEAIYMLAGCGTTSEALCFGGSDGVRINTTERWYDSSWYYDVNTAGTKMYFYQDNAPVGWTIDAGVTGDSLLSVKGGSADYNIDGGQSSSGNWVVSGITGGDHQLVVGEIPTHIHEYTFAADMYSGPVPGGSTWKGTTVADTGDGSADGLGGGVTGAIGNNHNHGASTQDGSWRPLASVGIICEKD